MCDYNSSYCFYVVMICCIFGVMWTNYISAYLNWWCTNTYVWLSNMNRRFILFILSTTFRIVSGLGVGLGVATLAAMEYILHSVCVWYWWSGHVCIIEHKWQSNCKEGKCMWKKNPQVRGQENCTNNDLPPPPKRNRKGKFHDDHHCGPCTVWI